MKQPRISRTALETIRSELRALPDAGGKSPLRVVVGGLYEVIREKREKRVRWAAIHETISEQFPITLKTLTMYYAEEDQDRKRKDRRKARSG